MARRRADIDVEYRGDWYEVDGYVLGDTIAANRTLTPDRKAYAPRDWNVTHMPTGQTFIGSVPKAVAIAFGERLVKLGHDGVHETDPDKAVQEFIGVHDLVNAVSSRRDWKVRDLVAYVEKLSPAKLEREAEKKERAQATKRGGGRTAASRQKDEREARERRPLYKKDLAVYRKLKPGDVVRVWIVSTSWHAYDGQPGREPKRFVDYEVVSKSQGDDRCLAELKPGPGSTGAQARRWGTLLLRGSKGDAVPNSVVLQHRPKGEGSAHTTGAWVHLQKVSQPAPRKRRKPKAAQAVAPVEVDFMAMLRQAEE